MDALTPFWDYHGCCVRPYLPLRLVCFQEDPLIPPPEDLKWGVHIGVDPRPQANFLNDYEWGAPCTDQLIWCHRQDQGQHNYFSAPDFRGLSSSTEPTVPEVRWYANITHQEVWLHDNDGADTHMDWPTEGADGFEIKERPYNYFCWRDRLQSQESLQRNYDVLQPATKCPDDATGQTVNWSTLWWGLWYQPDQVTKATQYDHNDIWDAGPKSQANRRVDEWVYQMIYDFKDDCVAGQLHRAGREIHQWSDNVFANRVWDLWDRMKSRYEDDQDSDLEDNNNEDVCFTSKFHCKTQPSRADVLNGRCALEPKSTLSPGQAATEWARKLDPYNLPEDDLRGLPEWEVQEKLKPVHKDSSKADWETASHLPQNNLWLCPHLWIHSTEGSGSWIHEIIGIEGIIHLRDLASQLEHDLHLSELVAPFLPALNPFEEPEISVLKFLERHTRTTREKLVSHVKEDCHFTQEYDYYWTSCPLSN